jgi:hypothetical protein
MTSCPEQTGSLAIRDLDFGNFCFGELDWIAVCGSGFEPQTDRFFDICEGLFSCFPLGNTTGEIGDLGSNEAALVLGQYHHVFSSHKTPGY